MPRIYVYYSYRDAKNEIGRNEVNLPFSLLTSFSLLMTYASNVAVLIDAVTTCMIFNAGIAAELDIGGIVGLKTAPIVGSDVEEGGKFTFSTDENTLTSTRIPGFDETYVATDSRAIDLTATDVDALMDALVTGQTISSTLIGISDRAGNDVKNVVFARESFQSSRN